MIFGISCGREGKSVLFGAGSSDFCMASLEASSMRSDMRVDTVWRRKVRIVIATSRKIMTERRISRGRRTRKP